VVKEVDIAIIVDLVWMHLLPQIAGYGNVVLALHVGVPDHRDEHQRRRQNLSLIVETNQTRVVFASLEHRTCPYIM
jgi:hypothetical protein